MIDHVASMAFLERLYLSIPLEYLGVISSWDDVRIAMHAAI
jgi:hypothetical protein